MYAHKHLMDLENSRDELLYEIHRQPVQSKTNVLTISTYFKEVGPLNTKLEKKASLKIGTNILRGNPSFAQVTTGGFSQGLAFIQN